APRVVRRSSPARSPLAHKEIARANRALVGFRMAAPPPVCEETAPISFSGRQTAGARDKLAVTVWVTLPAQSCGRRGEDGRSRAGRRSPHSQGGQRLPAGRGPLRDLGGGDGGGGLQS